MTIEKKIEELKNRFSVGKIPTEADFGKLIDLANEANSLLGIDTKADISNSKLLNGLEVKNKELQVKIAKNSGLKVDENGISINTGSGISVDDNGVHLNVTAGKGITITKENVIEVAPWSGIGINNKGDIELRVGTGLSVGEEGVKLKIGDGLTSNSNGQLTINIPPNQPSGLISDANGLRINLISADNATTPGKENFLTLNGAGQLGLTTEGLNRIKEGSKSKFNTALAAAVGKAVAEKKVAPDFADTLGENDSWDAPITSLVDAATSYTSAEKAKERLEKKISAYLADPNLVAKRPTNDNLRINFSYIKNDDGLYYGSERFTLDSLASFWSEEGSIDYQNNNSHKDYVISASNFITPGFYAFAGKLTALGQTAKNDANGQHLTANAIMVYIGTGNFVYTVGYWDLSTEPFEFYQYESEPTTNAVTRHGGEELKVSAGLKGDWHLNNGSTYRQTITESSNLNTFTLNVTGGSSGKYKYSILENKNGLTLIDIDKGIFSFNKYSNDLSTLAISDPGTRIKNPSETFKLDVRIFDIDDYPTIKVQSLSDKFVIKLYVSTYITSKVYTGSFDGFYHGTTIFHSVELILKFEEAHEKGAIFTCDLSSLKLAIKTCTYLDVTVCSPSNDFFQEMRAASSSFLL